MSSVDNSDESVELCEKNPGHEAFLSLDECLNLSEKFMQRLPKTYHRDTDLLKDLLRSLADLTVKVVSDDKMGTGFIEKVNLSSNEKTSSELTCRCENCQKLGHSKKMLVNLYVTTAAHVMNKNDNALRNTVCSLFYDSVNSKIVKAVAFRVDYCNENEDTLCLVYSTCEMQVFEKISQTLKDFSDIKNTLDRKYNIRRSPEDLVVIMVSHPHGMFKHVTIGPYSSTHETSLVEYSAESCSGSSGAKPFPLGGVVNTLAIMHIGFIDNGTEKKSVGNSYTTLDNLKAETVLQQILSQCQKVVKYFFPRYNYNI